MSIVLEIVVPDLSMIDGLVEDLTSWGGENLPYDPPRYRFGVLKFEYSPLPRHVQVVLPKPLQQSTHALTLQQRVVADLSSRCLTAEDGAALRNLIVGLSQTFPDVVVVYDTTGGALRLMSVRVSELYERLIEITQVVPFEDGCFVLVGSSDGPNFAAVPL